ncbi:conserved hypothetical protein [Xenorhabdus nematophila F1]|uniref:Uncharacterized protein n=1 Tax=Xenorhabdus nematophila (strain ATCC 19061 / DSM 3370 / CCUG 14189 / LMG 1036 / NCIMB 9965 / AN6) TaxID=406817 RepID=D3VDC7_XENNA|nr:hypothetical protein XNC1_4142 [Xenorhabdus nematophila ATCC 19061]CCW30652.1 conserved hypothetical protein [Xenorhabdus nematophila F1]CEE90808.1 hypothetical protein XNA1_1720009 [Xenorhabdus nematophila str. Anatoliense]CEF28972.1 hypothetical protein XNW1_1470008 [Xenorhabdus nematophila str. Websteri]CEK24982.1 hypothetical protein XNC2_3995 [Xenorhabdus nematophila AN6/1]
MVISNEYPENKLKLFFVFHLQSKYINMMNILILNYGLNQLPNNIEPNFHSSVNNKKSK